jgi:hypothetical protein
VVAELSEDEASRLVELGIALVRGQGMLPVRGDYEIEFVGLFDSARPREDASGFSVPPPVVATASTPPARASLPPGQIREPARALFVPVASAVLARIKQAAATYRQALFVIRADEPIAVSLTVLDGEGLMRSIEVPASVTEAASRMVVADRADGNGPWRKLSARIFPKGDGGASLNVDVT